MTRAALILSLLLAPTVASAQDMPFYAPCLERFETVDDYIAAFEAEGWTHRTWEIMRNRAAPPLAEIRGLMTAAPNRFQTAVQAEQYAAAALERYQEFGLEFVEILTLGDLSASVAAGDSSVGFIVRCDFAGPSLPEFDALFGDSMVGREELAFSMGRIEVDAPDAGADVTVTDPREVSITAVRIEGDDAVLAPLSAREGVWISVDYGDAE